MPANFLSPCNAANPYIGTSALIPFNTTARSSLLLELRADSIAGNDGDLVSTWQDQSGNGNDVTQSTTSFKPALWANVLGAHSAVVGDGIDDRLTCALSFTGSACTIISAIGYTSAGTTRLMGMHAPGVANDSTGLTALLPFLLRAGDFQTYRNSGLSQGPAMSQSTPYLLTVRIAANGAISQKVNATSANGFVTGGAFNWDNLAIGAGWVSGVPAGFTTAPQLYHAIYNTNLSDAELTAACNQINAHYGIF